MVDIFSILGHLSRRSEDAVVPIIKILRGNKSDSAATGGEFHILVNSLHANTLVKSRCCNLIGNLMKYSDAFYDVLKRHKPIFDSLIECCQIDELNVRKVCHTDSNSNRNNKISVN